MSEAIENKNRLLRYLAKMEKYKDNAFWMNHPDVVIVHTDGRLDLEKVQRIFEKRGFMTAKQFEDAYILIKQDGELGADDAVVQKTLDKALILAAQEKEEQELDTLAREY